MNEAKGTPCVQFELLDRKQQVELLHQHGVYIGKLKEDECCLLLFQYESIYVEIRYKIYRWEIDTISCFADTAVLDRYLFRKF